MGELVHSTMAAGIGEGKGIHISYALEYNNHSDRESGINELNSQILTDEYLGKDARVHSDNSRWMLVQVTPTILWVRVGGDESLNETTEDFDIYLDPVSGDDDANDGSELYPYKSFGRMFQDIPENVKHRIRVYPKAGIYTEENIYFERNYIDEGQLIIDASGETYPIIAGPFTVVSSTGIGPIGPEGRSLAYEIQASGVSWTDDEFYPYHLYALDGNWQGYCLPIHTNTTDKIQTLSDWNNFQAGDTFNVVDCPVDLRVNGYCWIKGKLNTGANNMIGADVNDPQESPYMSSILTCGIKITANITRKKHLPFRFENFVGVFSFCTLINEDTGIVSPTDRGILGSHKWIINNQPIKSGTFVNPSLGDWYMLSLQIANKTISDLNVIDVFLSESKVASMVCRGAVSLSSNATGVGDSYISYSIASYLSAFNGFSAATYLYLEQIGTTKEAINTTGCILSLNSVYIKNCDFAVEAFGGQIVSKWFKGESLLQSYAVHLQDATKFIKRSDDVSITGTTGAIYFVFDGSTSASWPSSGTQIDDGAGCRVIAEHHVP